MIIIYDCEVLKYDWIMVFKEDTNYRVIHNNPEELKEYVDTLIKNKSILVGFNNYYYDDMILSAILLDKDPYELSKNLIAGEKGNYRLNLITLDVIQELGLGIGLKSSQANLGLSIVETPINFDLDRPCSKKELDLLIGYCKNDVKDTEMLFLKRQDYFQAKFEIVNEFNLPITALKNTRAVLASKVLECVRIHIPNDRLFIDYDPNINWNLIPQDIKDFYNKCEDDYRRGVDYKEIENRKLKTNIAGVPHVYAFGGLHGALEKYNAAGNFLHIDVSSYYPSLIINNNFMSRASKNPKMFTHLRETRYKLKAEKNQKNKIYKILINATFGAMKSEFNMLYDPKQANNICINGQLILTQLIYELEPFCQLIQSNTDGLVVKYKEVDYDKIVNIIKDFGKRFNLTFDIDKIIKIAQRDVNNYAIQFEDRDIEAKGRFSKFEGGNFEQNSLTIIDKALVNYYIHDIPVHQTVLDCYKNNDLTPFQIICKMGSTYDGMFYEKESDDGEIELIKTQKVNRVFATSDTRYGGIYKRKNGSYQKIANTSEHNIIHNENINTFDKTKLDLNYYINLCKKNLY